MGRKRKNPSPAVADDAMSPEDDPPQRNAANSRERTRMRVLSKAFVRLKTTLPWVPPDTKLSKLDTLKLATCYIAHLRQILAEDSGEDTQQTQNNTGLPHPINLTWPFSFQGNNPGKEESPEHHTDRSPSSGNHGNNKNNNAIGASHTALQQQKGIATSS